MKVADSQSFDTMDKLSGVERTYITRTNNGSLYKRSHSNGTAEIGYLIIKPDGSMVTYNSDETAKAYGELF